MRWILCFLSCFCRLCIGSEFFLIPNLVSVDKQGFCFLFELSELLLPKTSFPAADTEGRCFRSSYLGNCYLSARFVVRLEHFRGVGVSMFSVTGLLLLYSRSSLVLHVFPLRVIDASDIFMSQFDLDRRNLI